MLYEIKVNYKGNKRSFIATEIKFKKQYRFNSIGFIQKGKTHFTWYRIETIGEAVGEITVCEATTGREMYTFNY